MKGLSAARVMGDNYFYIKSSSHNNPISLGSAVDDNASTFRYLKRGYS